MLEADESCTPNIVEDNYTMQVMSASLGVLQTLRKRSSLCKGPGETPKSVLYTLRKA